MGKSTTAAVLTLIPMLIGGTAFGQEQSNFWQTNCNETECVASQTNANTHGDAVMRTDISRLLDNSLQISVRVPNTVLLDDGPWLTVEGVYLAALKYVHCANGCVATVNLPQNLALGLLNASEAAVTVVSVDGSHRGIPIDLLGLSDALSQK